MQSKIQDTDQTHVSKTNIVTKTKPTRRGRTPIDPITKQPDPAPLPSEIKTMDVTPEQVQELANLGCTKNEIARLLRTSPDVIEQYNDDFMFGINQLKRNLRRKQIELALDGNPNMLIWLGKNLLGQVDKPIDLDSTIDYIKFEMISTNNQSED